MSERKFPGRDPGSLKMIEHLYNKVPAFNDVFDEETFYICVIFFVVGTLLIAYIGSRYITIKPVDWFITSSNSLNLKDNTFAILQFFDY